ncbi:MAG: class I SAM-dependent methyltransferase [Candidatus Poribacteria bacterium]|nr:class I SAM-dependent methyltransferase [Candidatus Poribacteria bacterium]
MARPDRISVAESNRRAWNQAAPVHRETQFARLVDGFSTPGFSCLAPTETGLLHEIGIEGRAVAQLCCNNGRELLSVKNLGAGECVGFDLSDEFIGQARELATIADLDVSFVREDVYSIPPTYDGRFDLAYVTIGALCWLPDLDEFLRVVARLLKDDGSLFLYDMHPILGMFECADRGIPLPRYSYFKAEPFVELGGIDYYGGTTYESAPSYCFQHPLGAVFSACLSSGFVVTHFKEYDKDISSLFEHFEPLDTTFPLSYTLVARKV